MPVFVFLPQFCRIRQAKVVFNYSGTLEFSTLTIFLWPCHILVVKQAD